MLPGRKSSFSPSLRPCGIQAVITHRRAPRARNPCSAASLECMSATRFSRRTQDADLFAWLAFFTATVHSSTKVVRVASTTAHESYAYQRDRQMIYEKQVDVVPLVPGPPLFVPTGQPSRVYLHCLTSTRRHPRSLQASLRDVLHYSQRPSVCSCRDRVYTIGPWQSGYS